jgi:hypothetical protein
MLYFPYDVTGHILTFLPKHEIYPFKYVCMMYLTIIFPIRETQEDIVDNLTWNSGCKPGWGEILDFLRRYKKIGYTPKVMDYAAYIGNLEAVKWFHKYKSSNVSKCNKYYKDPSRQMGCTINAMTNAAINGKLDVVDWLYTNRKEGCLIYDAILGAVKNDHIDIIKWFYKNNPRFVLYCIDDMSLYGSLKVVKWIYYSGLNNDLYYMTMNKRVDVRRWVEYIELRRFIVPLLVFPMSMLIILKLLQ